MSKIILGFILVGVVSGIIGLNPVSGLILPKKSPRYPLSPIKNLGSTKQYPVFAFNQCLDHFTQNGCDLTWNQVSVN